MFSNIGVVGAGAMGTAIAQTICENTQNVLLYARREEVVNSINETHFNKDYFPNIPLNHNIIAINDLNELKDAEIIFLTLPSSSIREATHSLRTIISDDCVIVNTAKGLEKGSQKRMSEVIEEETNRAAAVLSGPNIASEMVEQRFSSASIACKNKKYLEKVKKSLSTPKFKVSASDDVIGVEYCGVIKNIIAISQGICEGMKINDNARFSVFTKTYNETKDLIEKFGGNRSTVDDYCGFGDIITASTQNVSRNHTLGVLYGQKIVVDEKASGVLFEGKNTIIIMKELCDEFNFECATVDFTYDVIIDRINPKKAFEKFWDKL
ncbi:NAD(P)H-dependent glycerol-3-phosphate dehydrogenase [Methanobrevibacter sp.]|uniref:NAD(P)H-dependent glycerol-3-phosphate dehydrogenase n=1 Tax=Methanobrevibacter sp. TaxID=66852 RepID=UPI0025CDA7C3|nr:NAD(P)H-dependent glycerol-3-phosphate dehydrogenase [Methanobrevibacter sp.]MBR4448273.1 NAD(P)H-dependent glycerol-3-phosphate dehydrogenase [Methanobrevibacter sp.]